MGRVCSVTRRTRQADMGKLKAWRSRPHGNMGKAVEEWSEWAWRREGIGREPAKFARYGMNSRSGYHHSGYVYRGASGDFDGLTAIGLFLTVP